MIVDTDKIEWLLENRSQYFINKETGVAQSRLSKLKNNSSEIGKSSIEIGARLTTLALQEQQIENKGEIKMTKTELENYLENYEMTLSNEMDDVFSKFKSDVWSMSQEFRKGDLWIVERNEFKEYCEDTEFDEGLEILEEQPEATLFLVNGENVDYL